MNEKEKKVLLETMDDKMYILESTDENLNSLVSHYKMLKEIIEDEF